MIKKTLNTLMKNKKIFLWFAIYSAVGIAVITVCEFIMHFVPDLPPAWVSLWERGSDIRIMELISIFISYSILILIVQPQLIKYILFKGDQDLKSKWRGKPETKELNNTETGLLGSTILAAIGTAFVFNFMAAILIIRETTIIIWILNWIFLTLTPIGYLIINYKMKKIYADNNRDNSTYTAILQNGITYLIASSIPLFISLSKIFYLTDYVYFNSYHLQSEHHPTSRLVIEIVYKFGIIPSSENYFLMNAAILFLLWAAEVMLLAFINTYFANKILKDNNAL